LLVRGVLAPPKPFCYFFSYEKVRINLFWFHFFLKKVKKQIGLRLLPAKGGQASRELPAYRLPVGRQGRQARNDINTQQFSNLTI